MWWLGRVFAADCPEPVTRQAFIELLTAADVAVMSLDAEGLASASAAADIALPCLSEVLEPEEAAWAFRVAGVAAFTAGSDQALGSFMAARALAPGYKLSSSLGLPAQELWAAAEVPPREAVPLPLPVSGWLLVDGNRSTAAPGGRAFILQWADDSGVRLSARVDDAAVLPDYPSVPVPAPRPVPVAEAPMPNPIGEPPESTTVRHTSRPLAVGAAVTGVGAVGLAVVASSLRARFVNSDQPSDELGGVISANRATGGAALGLGAAAVGLGAGAVIVGKW